MHQSNIFLNTLSTWWLKLEMLIFHRWCSNVLMVFFINQQFVFIALKNTYIYIYIPKNINEIDSTILLNKCESVVSHILLYGDGTFKNEVNLLILNETIDFVLSTNRFDDPLYLFWIHGYFSIYFWLYGYNFQFLRLVSTSFFVYLTPIKVMELCDCCFYVFCVNVHFHRKKSSAPFPKLRIKITHETSKKFVLNIYIKN